MNALAKAAAHGLGQKDCGVAVFIAQPVRGGKRAGPSLLLVAFQQVHLFRQIFKIGGLYAQQSDGSSPLPVGVEQFHNGGENFCIHLGWAVERMRARDGGEI